MSGPRRGVSRTQILFLISIFGICDGIHKEIDLDKLKNELQVIHNLTDKLEHDLQSYEIQQNHIALPTENANKDTKSNVTPRNIQPKAENTPDKIANAHWPSFEELLLLSNRKYDWKNDRWIKIKPPKKVEKMTTTPKTKEIVKAHASERDKFIFRTVRYDHNSTKHYIVAAFAKHKYNCC